jgi:enamine deaminase RidA (YjgF/YER057c/UK114 family)
MPCEKEYGYAQAVKVEDTIYVSGQVSHDDGGNIVGRGDMEARCFRHTLILRRCRDGEYS